MLIEAHSIDRDSLLTAADKLQDADLLDAAAKVRGAADDVADHTAADIAEITADSIRGNIRSRLASLYRQGKIDIDTIGRAEST
jgi:hypothetical protein